MDKLKGVSRVVPVPAQVPALSEGMRDNKGLTNVAWVNVGDCMPRVPLGVVADPRFNV